ncbi:hypothetical protein [Streptomyces sp. NPDC047043]|uniref:hypothetical protein n=1 Tax=Streptomyces sp. NPDC047043 TaxID=3154497 RepID=UPI0033CE82D2
MSSSLPRRPQTEAERLKRQLGGYIRLGSTEQADETRRKLRSLVLEEQVRKYLAAEPTPEDRARFAAMLLHPAQDGGGSDA